MSIIEEYSDIPDWYCERQAQDSEFYDQNGNPW